MSVYLKRLFSNISVRLTDPCACGNTVLNGDQEFTMSLHVIYFSSMEIILSHLCLAYKAASQIYVNMVDMNGAIYLKKVKFNSPFRNDSLDEF